MSVSEIAEEFQKELNSILESKPPISKAKMNSIVKAAIKSIKYYKHVVYYVESFIKNCTSEYKIAGLYVIDAIIRHSRYQFLQNDLFAPRFSKNLYKTFVYLFKCQPSEKEKISKVLQLWQKNNIFSNELIEKLTKLSDYMSKNENIKDFEKLFHGENVDKISRNGSFDDNFENIEQMKKLKRLQKSLLDNKNDAKIIDNNLLNEIHKLTSELLNKKSNDSNNKSNDENENTFSSDKELELEALIEENKRLNDDPHERLRNSFHNCTAWLLANNLTEHGENDAGNENSSISNQTQCNSFAKPDSSLIYKLPQITNQQAEMFSNILQQSISKGVTNNKKQFAPNGELDDQKNKRFKRSKSEDKSESSSSSALVTSTTLEAASNREKDRKSKKLPPIKPNHLMICSKTIWIGHLAKTTSEEDLKEIVEEYGQIIDIHMIPPRGCAYIKFQERHDAAKCLEKLKDSRIQGNSVKIAWAPNKGIKDKLKIFWNVELGCTYLPWNDLKDFDINFKNLSDGGFIDEDTLPPAYKKLYDEQMDIVKSTNDNASETSTSNTKEQSNTVDLVKNETITTQAPLMEKNYFENLKDLFDPSKPPPVSLPQMQFFPNDQQIHQHKFPFAHYHPSQQQNPIQFMQQILSPNNEVPQSSLSQQQPQHHFQHQHMLQNISLIHSQPNSSHAYFIRGLQPSSFQGSQFNHNNLQTPPPPPSAAANILNGSLMPNVLQSQLNNQIANQQASGTMSHNISGIPLQMMPANMLGTHANINNQNRHTYHLSPQVQFLQRPILTQQGHFIQGIRQFIPGTILQQFQQSDLNEINLNENNCLNNSNQVHLVNLANRSMTPNNSNLQLRSFPSAPQAHLQTAGLLPTPGQQFQHQEHLPFNPNLNQNDLSNQKHEQSNLISMNYQASKQDASKVDSQMYHEQLALANDANNHYSLPSLMNMNFKPPIEASNKNLEVVNGINGNNSNIEDDYGNMTETEGGISNEPRLNRFDRDRPVPKQYSRLNAAVPVQNDYFMNGNDKNRNFENRHRNNNFMNKKPFNYANTSNNYQGNLTWNKPWRNNNNYHYNNKFHNNNRTVDNSFNNVNDLNNSTANIREDSYNNNIEDMSTSDDEHQNNFTENYRINVQNNSNALNDDKS